MNTHMHTHIQVYTHIHSPIHVKKDILTSLPIFNIIVVVVIPIVILWLS